MTDEDRRFMMDVVRYVGGVLLILAGCSQFVGVI